MRVFVSLLFLFSVIGVVLTHLMVTHGGCSHERVGSR